MMVFLEAVYQTDDEMKIELRKSWIGNLFV
jgi:hypothetical protein